MVFSSVWRILRVLVSLQPFTSDFSFGFHLRTTEEYYSALLEQRQIIRRSALSGKQYFGQLRPKNYVSSEHELSQPARTSSFILSSKKYTWGTIKTTKQEKPQCKQTRPVWKRCGQERTVKILPKRLLLVLQSTISEGRQDQGGYGPRSWTERCVLYFINKLIYIFKSVHMNYHHKCNLCFLIA